MYSGKIAVLCGAVYASLHAVTHMRLHSACVIAQVFSYGGQPEPSYCIICADRFALAQSVSSDYFQ